MRVHHIPVRRTEVVDLPQDWLATLPRHLVLATTAQFLHQRDALVRQLEAVGKTVTLYQPRHTFHAGQILGCSTEVMDTGEAFLYVGEGLFHPQALAYANDTKDVHCYDPVSRRTSLIDREEIARRKRMRAAGIAAFYHAKDVGVLLSTKSGQKDELAVKRLREEFPDKRFYVFLGNTLGLEHLEDFPFVQLWLNTACPRIGYDDIYKTEKPLINAEDVLAKHRF